MPTTDPTVRGFCPMGCGETLYLDDDHVMCGYQLCPRPGAAGEILAEPLADHVVIFDEVGFTIRHPLRERLDGQLEDCELHGWCLSRGSPPVAPGKYRVPTDGEGVPTGWHLLVDERDA